MLYFPSPPRPRQAMCIQGMCRAPSPFGLLRGPLVGQSQNHSTASIFFRSQFPRMCGGEIFYCSGAAMWIIPRNGRENTLEA